MSYAVPNNQVEILYEVKKSKFIARAQFASSRDQAMQHLKSVQSEYPDARHHCWAYVLGHPDSPTSAAMDDDGEPSGTAGKPILNVLQHKHIGDIMVIITRYFGGIKLGAGGLIRAYSAATQLAIDELSLKEEIVLQTIDLVIDYQHEQFVRHLTGKAQGLIAQCYYRDNVLMRIKLPLPNVADFVRRVSSFAVIKDDKKLP